MGFGKAQKQKRNLEIKRNAYKEKEVQWKRDLEKLDSNTSYLIEIYGRTQFMPGWALKEMQF